MQRREGVMAGAVGLGFRRAREMTWRREIVSGKTVGMVVQWDLVLLRGEQEELWARE